MPDPDGPSDVRGPNGEAADWINLPNYRPPLAPPIERADSDAQPEHHGPARSAADDLNVKAACDGPSTVSSVRIDERQFSSDLYDASTLCAGVMRRLVRRLRLERRRRDDCQDHGEHGHEERW